MIGIADLRPPGAAARGVAVVIDGEGVRCYCGEHPPEADPVSGHPIRKEELAVLEALGRGQPTSFPPDDAILERLAKLGLISQRAGRWSVTERGKMDLVRRKSLKRSTTKS